MKITFVNHASFIIEHAGIKLICDPWMEGTAFDNGWKLLSATKLTYEDFSDITHIWFSHEHPDHFSPPNLLRIPKEYRERITILFQETIDRKVVEFCKKIGFGNQIELKANQFTELHKDFSILCNAYTYGDSYALIRVDGFNILNLNDCIVDSEKRAEEILRSVGEVDMLFTQYGYANKVGNEQDLDIRVAASREKLQRISYQKKFLNPKIIVPFASYVYFCHEENKYMNNGLNRIEDVYAFIKNELKTECFVLYPGDSWSPGNSWDSENSIQKYKDDFRKIDTSEFISATPVKDVELLQNCKSFLKKIKEGYPHKVRYINSLRTRIYITDYNKAYLLSGREGMKETKGDLASCDVALSSEALNYCFRELWGFDTLNINARFQTIRKYKPYRIFGSIAASLNRSEKFPVPTLVEWISKKTKQIIGT